jgi:hypothetical protein
MLQLLQFAGFVVGRQWAGSFAAPGVLRCVSVTVVFRGFAYGAAEW